jgi:hypothetical protein
MPKLTLLVLDQEYTIHRLNPKSRIPSQIYSSSFYSITRTKDELSIVCESGISVKSLIENKGWSCFKVVGPLDLNMSGIISQFSAVLAAADINILAISSYDTDYLLVKSEKTELAKTVLRKANYQVL